MFYSYKQAIEIFGYDQLLDEALASGKIYKVEKGVYSDSSVWTELSLIVFKNPDAIFTMESALYYHGFSEIQPEQYTLGTGRDAYKIKDPRVKQYFYPSDTLNLGVLEKEVKGTKIKIYSKERLLIEIIRHKKQFSFDFYKSLITAYRNRLFELDRKWFADNVEKFPASKKIMDAILLEVY